MYGRPVDDELTIPARCELVRRLAILENLKEVEVVCNPLVRILNTNLENVTIRNYEINPDKLVNYTICRVPSQAVENRKRKLRTEFNQVIPKLAKDDVVSLCLQFSDFS